MDERLTRAAALEAEAERLREDYADNPPTVVCQPYLIEDNPGEYRVGAKVGDYPYNGPCASVYADGSFVYVNTDDYEGLAMLNLEALPQLIEALQRLSVHLQTSGSQKPQ
jgi:hypothetical protein